MDQDLGVAGKTGSCIDKGSWVGLFASVAPIEQPKYAIAVITRGQSERGRYAAGIAAQIYHALAGTITRTDRNLAQTEFHIVPKNVAAAKKVVVNDDDSDDSDSIADGTDNMQVQPDGRTLSSSEVLNAMLQSPKSSLSAPAIRSRFSHRLSLRPKRPQGRSANEWRIRSRPERRTSGDGTESSMPAFTAVFGECRNLHGSPSRIDECLCRVSFCRHSDRVRLVISEHFERFRQAQIQLLA